MLEESPPPSAHGNDLMTPPEVLLKRTWAEAKRLTKEKEVTIDMVKVIKSSPQEYYSKGLSFHS